MGAKTLLSGQGNPACLADQPADHMYLSPACTTERKVLTDRITTPQTARRIHNSKRRLNCPLQQTRTLHMSNPRSLIDGPARQRQLARAAQNPLLFLQETAADDMQDRLMIVNRSFQDTVIVSDWPQLWADRLPDARVIKPTETLDVAEGSVDLAIHALNLHWAEDPVGQLIQLRRALRPDGMLIASLFGGQTLNELRMALSEAESRVTGGLSPRVLPMGDIRDLGGLLQRAGFALPVSDTFRIKVRYDNAIALMRELRMMGEGNALTERLRHPTRRDVLFEAARIYAENFADADGRIPATFEFCILTGWAPDSSQPQPLRPGSAAARLADALNTTETKLND